MHKFYLGQDGWGILYLLFFWTFIPSIVGFIEGILYLTMSDEDFTAKYGRKKEGKVWQWFKGLSTPAKVGVLIGLFIGIGIIGNALIPPTEEPVSEKEAEVVENREK